MLATLRAQAASGIRLYLPRQRYHPRDLLSLGRNRRGALRVDPKMISAPPGQDVTVSHPIVLNDRRIGSLVLLYDLGEVYERMWLYGRHGFRGPDCIESDCLPALLPVARRDRHADLPTGARHHRGLRDARLQHSCAKVLRRRTGASGRRIQRNAGGHPDARRRTAPGAGRPRGGSSPGAECPGLTAERPWRVLRMRSSPRMSKDGWSLPIVSRRPW